MLFLLQWLIIFITLIHALIKMSLELTFFFLHYSSFLDFLVDTKNVATVGTNQIKLKA